jgi:hypothetical protein
MRKTVNTLAAVLLFMLLSSGLLFSASGYPSSPLQEIYESPAFGKFYDTVYNCRTEHEILQSYEELVTWIGQQNITGETAAAAKARAALVLGRQYVEEDYMKDHQRAAELFDESLRLIDSVEHPDDQLELLLIKGEVYGSYFLINQSKYLFSYGRKSHDITQEIWKMDKANPRSIILKSNQLIYTPKLFGGDQRKARNLLLPLEQAGLMDVDRFTLYLCLGIIEKENRRGNRASIYFQNALTIYPGNNYVRELMEEL